MMRYIRTTFLALVALALSPDGASAGLWGAAGPRTAPVASDAPVLHLAANTELTVSNAAELRTALGRARGGETIRLKPGNYGELVFTRQMPQELIITGTGRAVFTGLRIKGASNLTVERVTIKYSYNGEPVHWRPNQIEKSSRITIRYTQITGDLVKGYGHAFGLSVKYSDHITILGNVITDWFRGSVTRESRDLVFARNEYARIAGDGINFAQVQRVLFEGNHIHDFLSDPNNKHHRDMLQFWTAKTNAPSTHITIRNNVFDMGNGVFTQSIFMRNEMVDKGQAGPEMFYRNIVIENNRISNYQAHGITVGETDGLTIRGNAITQARPNMNVVTNRTINGKVTQPSIRVSGGSRNVEITGNTAARIVGYSGQAGWAVRNNALWGR